MVKINSIHNKNVLIAPLDWGMGHTTRCVPIINALLTQHCTVTIAGNAAQQNYYSKELGSHQRLNYQTLQGYNIFYWNKLFTLAILLQLPKLLLKINYEHRWLSNYLRHNTCQIILSDNRYGLHNNSVTSILISHQLQLITPYCKRIINTLIARTINKFNYCWIPDNANDNEHLSGILSQNNKVTIPTQYIGALSRMTLNPNKQPNTILVLLTGPDAAKQSLLQLIITKYANTAQTVTVVNAHKCCTLTNITLLTTTTTEQLQALINTHSTIITRSGYTSIMDFYALQQPIQLIATPHQPEQEYLLTYVCTKFPELFSPFIN